MYIGTAGLIKFDGLNINEYKESKYKSCTIIDI